VALADHGRTAEREALSEKAGHRKYRPTLSQIGITVAEKAIDPTLPASRVLDQDPRRALAAIELQGDGQTWSPQHDLLDSDRFAPHFVAETESDGRVYLRFGDDLFGLHPSDDAFTIDDPADPDGALYRIGSGTAGNIGADTLSHIMVPVPGITRVRNPLPALGGTDPESLEEVRQYAPQAFRRQERAVTEADYAAVTERHPSVQRAMATRRWTGSWYTMFITIDRKGGLPVDADFEAEIRRHVERYRLAGHDVEIDPPRFVSLDIRMTVCVKPDYFRSEVKKELLAVFSNRILSDGSLGFFHPDHFTFGQSVYLSKVIAAAMSVTGVQWVDIFPQPDKDHRFQRWGEKPHDEIKLGKIEMVRLEIARLDNDPSLPENGKIEFYMEGGL
jgi:predicted phage baseplate assembly protein